MPLPLSLIKVNPIGRTKAYGFVEGEPNVRGLRQTSRPVYSPSMNGARLSSVRRRQQINIRDCARLLSIRSSELSKLEIGEMTLSEEEWEEVFALLSPPPRHPRLEKWGMRATASIYSAPEQISYYLTGDVYGHPKYADGTFVTTSSITETNRREQTVRTRRSTYFLGEPDPEYEKLFPGAKARFFDRGEHIKQQEKEEIGELLNPSKKSKR